MDEDFNDFGANMDYDFKFSVVMPIYNVEEYLSEAIDSLINQSIGFEENIELVIVDDESPDNSKEIALKYQEEYPDNIQVLSKPNGGQASAFNLGIQHVHGKYINFLDSDDYLSSNTFEEVYDFFEEHYDDVDLVSIPLVFFERRTGDHNLNYKFKSTRVIDLIEEPDKPQLSIPSSFVKNEALKGFEFNTELPHGYDALVVNKILLNKKKLGVVSTSNYYYRKRETNTSMIDTAYQKEEFYTYLLKHLYIDLIDYSKDEEGIVPKFIQYMIAYNIQWYYNVSDFPEFFSEEEIEEFWNCFYEVLSYIDEDVIDDRTIIKKIYVRSFLMYIKNHKDFHIDIEESGSELASTPNVCLKTADFAINELNKHNIYFDNITILDGFLNIYGSFTSSCNYDTLVIEAIKTSKDKSTESFEAETDLETTHLRRILGIDWHYRYHFIFKIPIAEEEDSTIAFNLIYEEDSNRIVLNNHIRFKDDAILFNNVNHLVKDNYILIFGDDSFQITPFDYEIYNQLREELYSNIQELLDSNKDLMKENRALIRQNNRLERKNENLINRNNKLRESLDKSRAKNEEILNSTSWKVTEPLRKSKDFLSRGHDDSHDDS